MKGGLYLEEKKTIKEFLEIIDSAEGMYSGLLKIAYDSQNYKSVNYFRGALAALQHIKDDLAIDRRV